MPPNGTAHAGLAPGHFLFTSESVGEGHPGKFLPQGTISLLTSPRQDLRPGL